MLKCVFSLRDFLSPRVLDFNFAKWGEGGMLLTRENKFLLQLLLFRLYLQVQKTNIHRFKSLQVVLLRLQLKGQENTPEKCTRKDTERHSTLWLKTIGHA